MRYYVDIDGTICCKTPKDGYHSAVPYVERIEHFNKLYDEGHEIVYWTARGGTSGKDWSELTLSQLERWGVKSTRVMMNKPSYDLWIDDKAKNVEDYFSDINNGK